MQQRVELGPCGAIRHDGDAARCAVLLPGLFYPTRAPALWFAREAALAHGWSALEVLGEPGEHAHPLAWERECAERALAAVGYARVLVIGKSLASLLAGSMSEHDLAAVWLTPLLGERSVIGALARARCPTLLIGRTADAAWQPEAIPNNPVLEVVQLPGVDHALQVPSDPVASLDALRQIAESVGRLAARV
jgi:hypothetical protein